MDIAKFEFSVVLNSDSLSCTSYTIPSLSWQSVNYRKEEISDVPDDRRGLYAFVISFPNAVLPPHSYVMYIGIAGRKSNRSLRKRYRDYFDVRKVIKRERIARMIGTWHSVLKFYYAPVEASISSAQLEDMEKELTAALLPPFSEGDLDAETKGKRKAFRV